MKNDILDDFPQFSNPLKQELYKHVNEGEEIIWAERPKQGILFRPSDGCLIPFSLAWGGFAIFWESMVFSMGAPTFMAIFGIPFVLIGLYLIIGRFFYDMYVRKNMLYGLTNKQIIVKRRNKVHSLDLSALTDVRFTKKKDGSGSISFSDRYSPFKNEFIQNDSDPDNSSYSFVQFNGGNRQSSDQSKSSNFSLTQLNMTLSFEAIPNVETVYNQIEELRNL